MVNTGPWRWLDPSLPRAYDRTTTRAKERAVRTYDDPVEVRKGPADWRADEIDERPEQFLWRGRLWQVREVLAHWRDEREVWRVTAARGRSVAAVDDPRSAVFDLVFDPGADRWCLAGIAD
jgi:hypothetical protein